MLAIVVNLPIVFPTWTVTAMNATDENLRREADFEPVFLPVLPPIADAVPGAEAEPNSRDGAHRAGVALSAAVPRVPSLPNPSYAGPQLSVSNPPHSTPPPPPIPRPHSL